MRVPDSTMMTDIREMGVFRRYQRTNCTATGGIVRSEGRVAGKRTPPERQ